MERATRGIKFPMKGGEERERKGEEEGEEERKGGRFEKGKKSTKSKTGREGERRGSVRRPLS